MKKLLISALMLGGSLVPALAADPMVDIAVQAPAAFDWSGFYVGAQAGYAWGASHALVTTVGNYADPDPDGFLGGIYAGYNHQFQNFVIGLDADIAYSDLDGTGQGFAAGGVPLAPGNQFDEDISWTAAARARLGYAFNGFLPYVAGGVAFAEVDLETTNVGVLITTPSETYTGWTIGGGVEYAFTDMIIGRLEYRYTDYGTQTFFPAGIPVDVDLQTHDLRVGISIGF